MTIRRAFGWLLAVVMVLAGANHFRVPEVYVAMMPAWLPAHLELVHVSGALEIAGGLGLLHPATRRAAGLGLVALFIAVFPANLNMALHDLPLGGRQVPTWALWARLPLQLVFIGWALWVSRPGSGPTARRGARAGSARSGPA